MSYIKDLYFTIEHSYHGLKDVVIMTEEEELELMDKYEYDRSTR